MNKMSSLENRDILRHMLMQRPSLQPENIKQVLPLNNNISSRSTEVVKQRTLVNSRRKTDAKRQQINSHLTEIINYQVGVSEIASSSSEELCECYMWLSYRNFYLL